MSEEHKWTNLARDGRELREGALCPMRDEDGVWVECAEKMCAWWEAVDGRCAILDIAIGMSKR